MKVKNRILILMSILFIFSVLTNINQVDAALQANSTTGVEALITWWLPNVRMMESTGGTLGLTDTINSSSLLSTADNSNNLDIHMQKNTEYGAMAILSASSYGNQEKIVAGGTTTGNKSGIYINLNNEWTAAGAFTEVSAFVNANSKYKNIYYRNSIGGKVGDATAETAGWHGGSSSNFPNNRFYGLRRSLSTGIFSYYECASNYSLFSRAVIVVGEGF